MSYVYLILGAVVAVAVVGGMAAYSDAVDASVNPDPLCQERFNHNWTANQDTVKPTNGSVTLECTNGTVTKEIGVNVSVEVQ